MTPKRVADDVLAKFTRRQHGWLGRVLNGSLDPEEVAQAIQRIIDRRRVILLALDGSYDASELVIMGGYKWVHDWITNYRFPLLPHNPMEREIEYVKLDYDPTSEEALAELKSRGLERPTYEHALYFGVKHPEEQEKHPVVFLHESVEGPNGNRGVIVLYGRPSRRCIDIDWFDSKWSQDCVFAGVRRVVQDSRQVFLLHCEELHSTSELVILGNYDFVNGLITNGRFPIHKHDPTEREIELVEFDHDTTSRDVLVEFGHLGLEQPTVEDALYFGIKYPDEQRKHTIAFLHGPGRGQDGLWNVLVLYSRPGCSKRQRCLDLNRHDRVWSRDCVFAGVRRVVSHSN